MGRASAQIHAALVVALVGACGGGKTETGGSDGSSGTATTGASTGTTTVGATTGTTTAATTGTTTGTTDTSSGTTASPTTTNVTTVGPSTDGTDSGENCPPGYSAGCCFGDGECCPCVGFDCEFGADPAAIEAFQVCACQQDVCADACPIACEGGGIDVSCFVCADKAGQTDCAQEFMACGGHLDADCAAPAGCEACTYCAVTGECYDEWLACWTDVGGCQDLAIQCEPMCGADSACLQECAEAFPNGPGLYQQYLDCVYCNTCAGECPDNGVTCMP